MTNEEKAKQISENPIGVDLPTELYTAVIEVAVWKDKQYKNKIEEAYKKGYNDALKKALNGICKYCLSIPPNTISGDTIEDSSVYITLHKLMTGKIKYEEINN